MQIVPRPPVVQYPVYRLHMILRDGSQEVAILPTGEHEVADRIKKMVASCPEIDSVSMTVLTGEADEEEEVR